MVFRAVRETRTVAAQIPAMTPVCCEDTKMITRLLGAAAMAAVVLAVAPASAARMQPCNAGNLSKTESAIETMADGDAKWAAFKEMTDAQTALLDGKMGACAAHLTKASNDSVMK